MIDKKLKWLDDYDLHARFAPGLLVLAPIIILIVCTDLQTNSAIRVMISLFLVGAGPLILLNTVSQLGREYQKQLFNRIGNIASNGLKINSNFSNIENRKKWRTELERITGEICPSEEEEAKEPQRSTNRVNAMLNQIKTMTSENIKFKILYIDNRNYGFERNLFAARILGLSISILTLSINLILMIVLFISNSNDELKLVIISMCLNSFFILFWIFIPSEKRVITAGERYAERLLNSLYVLP